MKAERLAELLSTWSAHSGPLHSRLSSALEELIRQGTLLPGVRLPAERALAKSLTVSRSTIISSYNKLRETGWLESRSGSGTWVSRKQASAARSRAHSGVVSRGSMLNLLQVDNPALIDLAIATTEPLAEMVTAATVRAHEEIGHLIAQRNYMPFGVTSLRQAIASFYNATGMPTTIDQILVTTGAQQAISLITALFVHRGDPVLVESPTYFGALECFRFVGARLFPLAVTKEHVVPEILRRRISAVQPRLVYLSPTCQNPTGAIMPTPARRQIATDASEHQVPIIEDETLADLLFRGGRPPSVASYSPDALVLTIGSLSKLICSALRVGWIRGPAPLVSRLARLKSATDMGSCLISQAIASELFSDVPRAMAIRAAELRSKRDLVIAILRSQQMPFQFVRPDGGMSLWVKLPGIDTHQLAQAALRHHVTIVPGNLFSADESHTEFFRIPFLLDIESLRTGVDHLMAACWNLSQVQSEPVEEQVLV
jgi:DNA-binding transcriptional MocR family regulator